MSETIIRLKSNTFIKLLKSFTFKIIFFFLLAQSSLFYGKEIVVGMINDNPHFYYPSHNSTMKRQKTDVINLLKRELKKQFKNDTIIFRYIDYDDSNLFKASKNIERQIKAIKPHVIFGPYLYKTIYYIKDYIEKSNIPFIASSYYSSLRNLDNYYTPYEWNDTRTKLAVDVAKRILKKDNPKIGAFVQVTDDHSMDSYEYIKNVITDDIYAIKLVHAKSDQYWNYKYKLDDNIKKMLAFSPDIILNSNSKDLDEITETVIYKMTNRGFKGIFIDTGSWGCSESSISRYINTYNKTKGSSTGISVSHKKCFKYYESEEKKFRNKIIHKDDKYYSNSGLFYKTLRHVLVSILNSPLELNPENVKKIIMSHPYFQGFSHTNYNLYKKKDSPEFLKIYKFYFRKDFRLENVSNKKLIKDVVKNFSKN